MSSTWFRVIAGLGKNSAARANSMPNGKRDWNQPGFEASLASNTSDKVFVCVDARAAAFEGDRIPLGSLHNSGNCLSHVVHMGRLQFCHAVAKDWISR